MLQGLFGTSVVFVRTFRGRCTTILNHQGWGEGSNEGNKQGRKEGKKGERAGGRQKGRSEEGRGVRFSSIVFFVEQWSASVRTGVGPSLVR